MSSPLPGLTVIVLTRDRREALRGALASLEAQEDPGVPLEFVVVDDGSADGSAETVRAWTARDPRRRRVRLDGRGVAAARNAGLRAARTAWIAIVADDYVLPPGYARTIAAFFTARPDAQVVRFKIVGFGGGYLGRALQAYQDAGAMARLSSGNRATSDHGLEAAGAAAFRRRVFDRVGLFDETYLRGEDTEFTARLRAAGIAVHYEPRVRIGHRPEARLGAVLRKTFASGRAARRLAIFSPGPGNGLSETGRLVLRLVPASLWGSLRRAWRTAGPAGLWTTWPILLVLETAYRTGYLKEASRPANPKASAPHLLAP